jgi:hypothetical protein
MHEFNSACTRCGTRTVLASIFKNVVPEDRDRLITDVRDANADQVILVGRFIKLIEGGDTYTSDTIADAASAFMEEKGGH